MPISPSLRKAFEERFGIGFFSLLEARRLDKSVSCEESVLSFIAEREEEVRREKEELASALISMYGQYCGNGHDFMSAGEEASTVLEQQGYAGFDMAGRMALPSQEDKQN